MGESPFRFIGVERRVGPLRWTTKDGNEIESGYPGQPMGTCSYCSQGIAECCIIGSADGKIFVVGNTCVNKTYDTALVDETKRAVNRHRRELNKLKDTQRIQDAKAALNRPEVREALAAQPHPKFTGKDMLGYVEYLFRFAGNAGMLRAARLVEKETEASK